MKHELSFEIEEATEEMLLADMEMYPGLRTMARQRSVSDADKSKKEDALINAELQTKIALLYSLYRSGELEERFDAFVRSRSGPASFGTPNSYRLLKFSSKVCRVLADLNVEKIGRNRELSERYHGMRVIVDEYKPKSDSYLYCVRFWKLYFEFYDAYTCTGSDS